MATCPKCGTGKAVKRSDGYYCPLHGFIRSIGEPTFGTSNLQDDLFKPRGIVDIARAHADVMSAEFLIWLPENLHIWEAYVAEVMKVIARGYKHYSSRTIIEVIRHHSAISDTDELYKINDHSVPYLSRLFDLAYPQHAGLFEYRNTTKAKGKA